VFLVGNGGDEYVLRVAPPDSVLQTFYERRMMRREPAIHARLRAETDVPVPVIAGHDFSRSRVDRDYLVMPRLPGVPLSAARLSASARDRACWGDVEWDLAIAEYCGVTVPAFWEGYGRRVETHDGDAAVRRFFYLLYEHQKYIVISMSTRRNDPAGARRYAMESLLAMDRFRRTGRPAF